MKKEEALVFSKEDFGYFFAPESEDEEKRLLTTKDLIVSVDMPTSPFTEEEEQPGETQGDKDVANEADGNHMKDAHPVIQTEYHFAKDELKFDIFQPVVVDNDPGPRQCIGQSLCCSCFCFFLTVFVGAILLFLSKNLETGSEDTNEKMFVAGGLLCIISSCCFFCGCLCCFAACFESCYRNSKDEDDGDAYTKPEKEFSLKLERMNDRFEDGVKGLNKIRTDLTKPFFSLRSLRTMSNTVSREKARLLQEKKREIQDKISEEINNGYTPLMISKRLRPCCFKIDFRGDILVSTIEILREQISLAIRLGTPHLDIVLVTVSSPGGAVSGYGLAASQLVRVKNAGMKLVVCVDSIAASGGYMMASVADEIYAAPFALVGSIGVISIVPNIDKLLRKHDIDTHIITAGEYKNVMNVIGEVTNEDKKKHKEELERIHEAFKAHIVYNRPKLADTINEVATGEAFLAVQAKKLGLVDSIATSDEVIERLSDKFEVILISKKKKKKGEFQQLMGSLTRNMFSWKTLKTGIKEQLIKRKLGEVRAEASQVEYLV